MMGRERINDRAVRNGSGVRAHLPVVFSRSFFCVNSAKLKYLHDRISLLVIWCWPYETPILGVFGGGGKWVEKHS